MSRSTIYRIDSRAKREHLLRRYGNCMLHAIVAKGDVTSLHDVLSLGHVSAIDAPAPNGRTALCMALSQGDEACVALLLQHGANADALWTPEPGGRAASMPLLHKAIELGNHRLVALLLGSGASHFHAQADSSALYFAVSQKQPLCVRILLEHGVNPYHGTRAEPGRTPLEQAVFIGQLDAARLLLKHWLRIEQADLNKALWYAVVAANPACVALLLEAGAQAGSPLSADLMARLPLRLAPAGITPLMAAAQLGHVAIMALLMAQSECLVNAVAVGETALHRAAKNGHADAVRLLLHHEANVDAKNRDGLTALELALAAKAYPCCAELLPKTRVSAKHIAQLVRVAQRPERELGKLLAVASLQKPSVSQLFAALAAVAEHRRYDAVSLAMIRVFLSHYPGIHFDKEAVVEGSCFDRIVRGLARDKTALTKAIANNAYALRLALHEPSSCLHRVYRFGLRWACVGANHLAQLQMAQTNLQQRRIIEPPPSTPELGDADLPGVGESKGEPPRA